MDTKAINEKSKALQKATAAGESPSIIVGILNDLKTGVVPSEDLLRSTKIGVIVNKSKQHPSVEVKTLAAEIVRKWRDDIGKQKGSTPNGKKTTSTPPNGTASPAPSTATSKSTSTSSVPPDQRSWKKDKVDVNRTGQSTRDNCIGLIYDGLVHLSTQPSSTVLSVASAVEAAAYVEHGPEDKEIYKSKMRSLYQNLKNKTNPSLRVKVVSGEIPPERFVVMTHDELKSAERREEDRNIERENMRAAEAPQAEKSVSTSLVCGKCGQRKVSYSQAQTRSADEPMTTFCECLVCGKRWKVSLSLSFSSKHLRHLFHRIYPVLVPLPRNLAIAADTFHHPI
ncbi:RNA polymerase II elongation factor [Loxospora ochrophaea]|nr:RNA polymerase II elongation factor [Loxospora ochrophaea]